MREAFWKEEPELRDALSLVESDEVFVVPLFLAEGYFTEQVVPRELAAGDPGRARVVLCPPIGTHPRMASLIEQRAVEACGLSLAERREAVLVVIGHGTERSATSGDTVLRLVERLREHESFGAVDCGFLDQAPRIEEVVASWPGRPLVLVPFFIAAGWHARTTIPRDLGLEGSHTERDGRRIWYTAPVGTLPEIASLVVESARDAGAWRHQPAQGTRSLGTAAREDLLAWVEAGEEGGRVFLQAWASGDGRGRFELRHEADRTAAVDALTVLPDAAALCDLSRSGPGGGYRLLRGSPDLRRGWRLGGLDGRQLWDALSALYPTDPVRWHRARSGALPVVPFAATAARQSGMYRGVARLRGEPLGRAVEAFCGSGRCLRTPLWAPGAQLPPAMEMVPCPEACSAFVAHARKLLEKESGTVGLSTRPPASA